MVDRRTAGGDMGRLRLTKPGPKQDQAPDAWRVSWRRKPPHDPEAMRELVSQLTPEERVVTHAAAIATKEARIRLTDRRLLVLFLVVVVTGAYLLHAQSNGFASYKRITNENCRTIQHGLVDKLNGYYTSQEKLTRARTDLPAQVRAQAIANYEKSKVTSLRCGR